MAATSKRHCQATNRVGEPCRAAPLSGSEFCSAHDPAAPAVTRFGSPEQAGRAGASPKPRIPSVREVMARRVEKEAEAILAPYFAALKGAVLHTSHQGGVYVSPHPDLEARMRAAERLLDRVYGRPTQATEVSGPDGGPIRTESCGIDLKQLSDEELEFLEGIVNRAPDP